MNESDCEHTVADIYERLINIEFRAGELYGKLSILFTHVPEISAFWKELAEDEIFHMNTLQEIYKSMTQEQLLLSTKKQKWKMIANIHALLNTNLIGSIKNLDDAYELAQRIEFSEINEIFTFLVTKYVFSAEQKQLVLSNIIQHHNKFMNFRYKIGDSTLRKQIRIQYT